jgi:hypothetical protein
MKQHGTILTALVLGAALLLSGCSGAVTGRAKVQQDSFGEKKKFALVTIASGKEFAGEKGLFQAFKNSESIQGLNTQPVLDQLAPAINEKFGKTGYYTVVPVKNVIDSKAYRNLQEDERIQKVAFFKQEINTASGYKYFSDPEKISQLARDLKVDGVICVLMHFSIEPMKSFVYVGPLRLGKKAYAANATISVNAYDSGGQLLWKDTTTKQAEPGDKKAIILMDFSDMSGTNFEKMHPSALLIGEHAADVIVQRFKDTMEGKKTSIFQKPTDKGTRQATGSKG